MTAKASKRGLSTGRVAELLGIDRSTVQGYCRRGELDHTTTPGGQYRVTAVQVEAFILRKTRPSARRCG